MWIKYLTTAASPIGVALAGSVARVGASEGADLIKRGYALAVRGPAEGGTLPGEEVAAPTASGKERRVRRRPARVAVDAGLIQEGDGVSDQVAGEGDPGTGA